MIVLLFVCFEKLNFTLPYHWFNLIKNISLVVIYFMIIIISVLEMVDLYRKDRGNSASRKVDLGLGETIKLYCIQAHIR